MLAPSLEVIVRLKPDLAIVTPSGNREETFEQLERLGIPVYLVHPTAPTTCSTSSRGSGS